MTWKDLSTVLDLLGLLLIVGGVCFGVWAFYPPAAVAVGGAGLLLVSWLADRRKGTP